MLVCMIHLYEVTYGLSIDTKLVTLNNLDGVLAVSRCYFAESGKFRNLYMIEARHLVSAKKCTEKL